MCHWPVNNGIRWTCDIPNGRLCLRGGRNPGLKLVWNRQPGASLYYPSLVAFTRQFAWSHTWDGYLISLFHYSVSVFLSVIHGLTIRYGIIFWSPFIPECEMKRFLCDKPSLRDIARVSGVTKKVRSAWTVTVLWRPEDSVICRELHGGAGRALVWWADRLLCVPHPQHRDHLSVAGGYSSANQTEFFIYVVLLICFTSAVLCMSWQADWRQHRKRRERWWMKITIYRCGLVFSVIRRNRWCRDVADGAGAQFSVLRDCRTIQCQCDNVGVPQSWMCGELRHRWWLW